MKKFVKGCLILAAAFRESGLKNWIWEIGSDVSEESFDWEK